MDMFAVVRGDLFMYTVVGERQLIGQIGVVGGCLRTDMFIVVMGIPYDVMQIDCTQRRVVIAFKESQLLIKTQKYVQGIHFEASGSTHTTLC